MDKGSGVKRPRGRPALPPEEGKRYALGIRTTRNLKDLLQKAADSSGRSVAHEIEHRLENSFAEETRWGGAADYRLAILLFAIFEHTGKRLAAIDGHPEWTTEEWVRDPSCFEGALAGLVRGVWAQHPNKNVTLSDFLSWCKDLHLRAQTLAASGFIAPSEDEASTPEQAQNR